MAENISLEFSRFVCAKEWYSRVFSPPKALYKRVDPEQLNRTERLAAGVELFPKNPFYTRAARTVGEGVVQVAIVIPASLVGIAIHGALLYKAENKVERIEGIVDEIFPLAVIAISALPGVLFSLVSPPLGVVVGLVGGVVAGIFLREAIRCSCSLDEFFHRLVKRELGLERGDVLELFAEGDDEAFEMSGGELLSSIAKNFGSVTSNLRSNYPEHELGKRMENILEILRKEEEFQRSRSSSPSSFAGSPEENMAQIQKRIEQLDPEEKKKAGWVTTPSTLRAMLGLGEIYSEEEKKKAIRKWRLKLHPDNGGSDASFTLLEEILLHLPAEEKNEGKGNPH